MTSMTSHHLVDRFWSVLRRAWWGGLLAIHIHPLLSTLQALLLEEFSFGRSLAVGALLALSTFFVLKIIDVRFLRSKTRREVLIAFWIITAMVHSNAAAGAIEVAAIAPTPVAVLAATAVVAAGALRSRRIRQRLRTLILTFTRQLAAQQTRFVLQRLNSNLMDALRMRLRLICTLLAAPRGPPLHGACS